MYIDDKLIALIRNKSGEPTMTINEHTRLASDLGLQGDDAFELLEEYGKEFEVDISRFYADNYFFGEGDLFYQTIYDLLYRLVTFKKRKYPLKELTVGELMNGITEKKLISVMNENETIYVQLHNDGVKGYRPVPSIKISDNIYILGITDNYGSDDEKWEFIPGNTVEVQYKRLSSTGEKEPVKVAIKEVSKK